MGFGLNLNAGGDFLPIVKFDARAGRIFRIDREDTGGKTRSTSQLLRGGSRLSEWRGRLGRFSVWPGTRFRHGADRRAAAATADEEPRPGRAPAPHAVVERRRAARSGCAKWRRRQRRAIGGLEALTTWLAGREQTRARRCVARLAGVKPVPSGGGGQKSTNYEPTFAIVKWVKAPAEFAAASRTAGAAPQRWRRGRQLRGGQGRREAAAVADAHRHASSEAEDDWG